MNEQPAAFALNPAKSAPGISAAMLAARQGNTQARQQIDEMCMRLTRAGGVFARTGKAISELLVSPFDHDATKELDATGKELLSRIKDELQRVEPRVPAESTPMYVGKPSDTKAHSGPEASAELMLNEHLNADVIHGLFESAKRIQILNIFKPVYADKAYHSLVKEVPWVLRLLHKGKHTEFTNKQYSSFTPQQVAQLQADLSEMDFIYYQFSPLQEASPEETRRAYIYSALKYIQSEQFISFISKLTGCNFIERVDVRGTCFSSGQFLKQHDDFNPGEHRLYAYVLNLSRDWKAEWGGLLHFLNSDGDVTDTLIPHFNSLSLFATPAPHFVSPIAPYAKGSRYSLTGWFYGS